MPSQHDDPDLAAYRISGLRTGALRQLCIGLGRRVPATHCLTRTPWTRRPRQRRPSWSPAQRHHQRHEAAGRLSTRAMSSATRAICSVCRTHTSASTWSGPHDHHERGLTGRVGRQAARHLDHHRGQPRLGSGGVVTCVGPFPCWVCQSAESAVRTGLSDGREGAGNGRLTTSPGPQKQAARPPPQNGNRTN